MRVIFWMIDDHTTPLGGVKVIFQAAGALRRRGIDAYVASPVGVPAWLADTRAVDDVAILDTSASLPLLADDICVLPDVIDPCFVPGLLVRPGQWVLFVQNHLLVHPGSPTDWARLRHIRCLTVSRVAQRHLLERCGFRDVSVVSPGVDLEVFRPAAKRRQIAYMPRKWPGLAETLRERVAGSVAWQPIDGRAEREVAAILGESTFFLNLGRAEGFGLPALEAMAAGCVVCGFVGHGMMDFATRRNGLWAGEGDVDGCVRVIEAALSADESARAGYVEAGRRTAAAYALDRFGEGMAGYFGGCRVAATSTAAATGPC